MSTIFLAPTLEQAEVVSRFRAGEPDSIRELFRAGTAEGNYLVNLEWEARYTPRTGSVFLSYTVKPRDPRRTILLGGTGFIHMGREEKVVGAALAFPTPGVTPADGMSGVAIHTLCGNERNLVAGVFGWVGTGPDTAHPFVFTREIQMPA